MKYTHIKFILVLIVLALSTNSYAINPGSVEGKASLSFGGDDKEEDKKEKVDEEPSIPSKLNFIDEGKNNSSFAEFREELIKKLEEKDTSYIRGMIDPAMKFNFGGASDFKKFYGLDNPQSAKNSVLWKEFKKIMALGGSFTEEGEFCAPYVFCNWPDQISDSGMAAITGNNIELKKSPGKSSATVATLNYNIVRTLFNSAALRAGWVYIQTQNGTKGFVHGDSIRRRDEHRAFFKQKNGKWHLTAYLS